MVAREFSVALTKLAKQFRLEAGFKKINPMSIPAEEFNKNIDQQMLPVIAGDAFDVAIRTIVQSGTKFDSKGSSGQVGSRKSGTDLIDILGDTGGVSELLDLPENLKGVELKNTASVDLVRDIGKKILVTMAGTPGLGQEVEKDLDQDKKKTFRKQIAPGLRKTGIKEGVKVAAQGYIPNLVDFADKRFKLNELPNLSPGLDRKIGDAVQREEDAGVPRSQIRVDFPAAAGAIPNLAKMPPVAVTNTRDEGNFSSASTAVATGIRKRQTAYRQANMSGNPMLAGTDMEFAAGGIIPNYAITRDELDRFRPEETY